MDRLTSHAELQELLGAYALDAVEPEDSAVVELHLASCPRCRTELAEHRETAAFLGYGGGTAPQGVWDRIIAGMEEPPPPFDLDLPRPPVQASPPARKPNTAGSTLASAWHALGSRSAESIPWHGFFGTRVEGAADADELAEFRRQARWLLGPSAPSGAARLPWDREAGEPSGAARLPWDREAGEPSGPALVPSDPQTELEPERSDRGRLPWHRELGVPPAADAVVVPITASSSGPGRPEGPGAWGPGGRGSSWVGGPEGRASLARAGTDPSGGRRSGKTVPMRWMVAIAATAALLLAALGVEIGHLETRNNPQQALDIPELAYQVALSNPNARHITLRSANGSVALQAIIAPDGETYLGTSGLQVLPSTKTYQMWGIVDGSEVSLGVIGDNAAYASFSTPSSATALAMTVEARGGVTTTSNAPVVEGAVPA